MSFEFGNALSRLNKLHKFGIKLGLENIRDILAALENPHHSYPSILVAGTNGKGSVTAYLSSIMQSAGLKVGRYTSPHLSSFTERININGNDVDRMQAARILNYVLDKADKIGLIGKTSRSLTYFEAATAGALLYFAEEEIDLAVLEVGMGGRFDATNICDPVLSLITVVEMDHMQYLGNTLEEIAFEKAGIFRAGIPAIVEKSTFISNKVLKDQANKVGADAWFMDKQIKVISNRDDNLEFDLIAPIGELKNLKPGLFGDFQIRNAAIAAAAAMRINSMGNIKIPDVAIREGLAAAKWPGRFEILIGTPAIILDGGHNPHAVQAFSDSLKRYFKDKKSVGVIGIMADKEVVGMVKIFANLFKKVFAAAPNVERSLDPNILAEYFRNERVDAVSCDSISSAIDSAIKEVGPNGLVVVAGSLYLVGEARIYLGLAEGDPI